MWSELDNLIFFFKFSTIYLLNHLIMKVGQVCKCSHISPQPFFDLDLTVAKKSVG